VTTIRTERLLLQTLTADEALAVFRGEREGRAWAPDYPTEGDLVVAGIVVEAGEHYDEATVYGVQQVRLAATGEAIGGIGFVHAPDAHGEAEIGYGLAASAQGHGLATEAVTAVAAWAAEQGLRVLVALTAPDNLASQGVLARCGFSRVGVVDGGEDGELQRWEHVLSV
jgi:RimJ/RimL family protein N-acetyltransferase